jgi:hypothetical protein
VVLTPDAGVTLATMPNASWPATVARKPGSPGRARRTPLKPLRREGRMFRRTCGDYARVLFILHTGLWVRWTPGFPCALHFGRSNFSMPRACQPRERTLLLALLFDSGIRTYPIHARSVAAYALLLCSQ